MVLGTRERIEHVSCVVSVEQRSVFLSVAVEPAVRKVASEVLLTASLKCLIWEVAKNEPCAMSFMYCGVPSTVRSAGFSKMMVALLGER